MSALQGFDGFGDGRSKAMRQNQAMTKPLA
jgi:hypothetical protein